MRLINRSSRLIRNAKGYSNVPPLTSPRSNTRQHDFLGSALYSIFVYKGRNNYGSQ